MTEPLDLDANVSDSALSSLESQYSPRQGSRRFDLDVVAVCRELRRLREENASLKGENQHTCTDYHDPCAQCDREEAAARRALRRE